MMKDESASIKPNAAEAEASAAREPRHFFIVSYDIPNDRRRAKIAKILEDFGERVQYSVFECWLRLPEYQRLQQRLKRVYVAAEDDIRFFNLCAACQPRAQVWSPRQRETVWKKTALIV